MEVLSLDFNSLSKKLKCQHRYGDKPAEMRHWQQMNSTNKVMHGRRENWELKGVIV